MVCASMTAMVAASSMWFQLHGKDCQLLKGSCSLNRHHSCHSGCLGPRRRVGACRPAIRMIQGHNHCHIVQLAALHAATTLGMPGWAAGKGMQSHKREQGSLPAWRA